MTQKLSLVAFEDSVLNYYYFLCIIFSVIPDPLTIEHDYLTFGSRVCWKVFNWPVIYVTVRDLQNVMSTMSLKASNEINKLLPQQP